MFGTQFIPPAGVRFNPTDEELIMFYLMKKVKGFSLPCDRVVERQLYGENGTPWKIFPQGDKSWNDCEGVEKNVVFVISRTAGCGTWEGKSLTQDVTNRSGAVIGQKRAFTFKPTKEFKSEAKEKGRWIMHELSLPEEINNALKNDNHYVICRITRDRYNEQVSGKKRKSQRSEEEEGVCWKKSCVLNYEEEENTNKGSLEFLSTFNMTQQEDSFGVNINNDDLIDISYWFDGDIEDTGVGSNNGCTQDFSFANSNNICTQDFSFADPTA
ncbi:hypothetical protein ACJIZ3_004242 [Penstemon smallii]|uniref:NAC domain-containing protein n=1 Tax=Penstemon smallii TaxID=265156 RepID=A0ABD3S1L0_9LAMI